MQNAKYKFELKFIHLENVLDLSPLEVAQKCQRCRLCVFTGNLEKRIGILGDTGQNLPESCRR